MQRGTTGSRDRAGPGSPSVAVPVQVVVDREPADAERRGDRLDRLAVGEGAAFLQQSNGPLLTGAVEFGERRSELPLEVGENAIQPARRFGFAVHRGSSGNRAQGGILCRQTDPGYDLAVPTQRDVVGLQIHWVDNRGPDPGDQRVDRQQEWMRRLGHLTLPARSAPSPDAPRRRWRRRARPARCPAPRPSRR